MTSTYRARARTTIGLGGIKFRSILESRWYTFLNKLGIENVLYEEVELGAYIPDFIIQFQEPFLIEVKPTLDRLDTHINKILDSGWRHGYLVVGSQVPDKTFFYCQVCQKAVISINDEINCRRCLSSNLVPYPIQQLNDIWIEVKNNSQWRPKKTRVARSGVVRKCLECSAKISATKAVYVVRCGRCYAKFKSSSTN